MKIQQLDSSEDLSFDVDPDHSDVFLIEVADDESGLRLDKLVAQRMSAHSRGRIQSWIEQGFVTVNGAVQLRTRQLVSMGDEILVRPQPSQEVLAFEPEDVPFEIISESDHWLVVNKRAGLVVHPGAGNWGGTLLNGLLFRYPALAHVARAGIVHRLDKDTSGLMVVAKTETAQTHLVRQLQERTVKRQYVALVHGFLQGLPIAIEQPIGRDPRVPVRMTAVPAGSGKPALTNIVQARPGQLLSLPVSEVRCRLQTGRTHQIRVHLSSMGHPLIGDPLYGGRLIGAATRQMLHAEELSFVDPETKQWVSFAATMPDDMQAVWGAVQWLLEESPDADD